MSNDKTIKTFFRENAIQLTLTTFGVAVAILNLWLAAKLAPLATGVESLNIKVSAAEVQIGHLQEINAQISTDYTSLVTRLDGVDQKLERIQNDIDRILDYLLKNK